MADEWGTMSETSREVMAGAASGGRAARRAWPGAMFCPHRGVNAGATQRVRQETARLLQARLKLMAPFLAVVHALAALRFVLVQPVGAVVPAAAAVSTAAAAAVLWRRQRLRYSTLVALKAVVVLGGLVLALAINQYILLGRDIVAADAETFVRDISRVPGLWLMVMLAYAMFIPDTWRQAAAFVVVCVFADLSVSALLRLHFGPVAGMLDAAELLDTASYGALVLATGGGLAVFGTHALSHMRRAAAEMSDAGMYRLLDRLGSGGMGEVWKAEHRLLARPAAIKIIRPDLLGRDGSADTATARFEREARATAALESPHTVQLYDFGVTHEGTFFYVMEFLRGLDLDQIVKRFGPLPVSRVVYLLRQAAESLHEAHRRGMVHRDVKPANIHVGAMAGEHDWVKVLDFGLVKSLREGVPDSPQLTREGVTTGTPAYFPPEMAEGASHADARSDIYALAAVAYYLVTGQLVFDGAGPMDIVVKHIRDEPVAPSRRVEVEIPAAVDEAILAGLRKSPDERPQTMLEFAGLLEAADPGPAWTEQLAADWWNLHLPEEFEPLVA